MIVGGEITPASRRRPPASDPGPDLDMPTPLREIRVRLLVATVALVAILTILAWFA